MPATRLWAELRLLIRFVTSPEEAVHEVVLAIELLRVEVALLRLLMMFVRSVLMVVTVPARLSDPRVVIMVSVIID